MPEVNYDNENYKHYQLYGEIGVIYGQQYHGFVTGDRIRFGDHEYEVGRETSRRWWEWAAAAAIWLSLLSWLWTW